MPLDSVPNMAPRAEEIDDPGAWRPVVDHARCEGKRDCIDVCPYDSA